MARLRAVTTIHAPGFAGTPSRGHRSAADEGVLHRVLGEVEVAEDATEDRNRAGPLVAIGASELLYAGVSTGYSTTGRTSIVPTFELGTFAPHSSASSSESALMR